MTVVTRFAPSPTGRLHVGNIRTALHNFLFARKHGGIFIVRIDDTDRVRSTAEFDQAIRDDLEWLGLVPEKLVRQSERFDLYEREFDRLNDKGARASTRGASRSRAPPCLRAQGWRGSAAGGPGTALAFQARP